MRRNCIGGRKVMGWIRERVLAEHRKHYRITGGCDWAKLVEQKIAGNLLGEIEWCRDWLDVGETKKDQENQLKVLMKLNEICDKLDVLVGEGVA